jgi:hypothetical protein
MLPRFQNRELDAEDQAFIAKVKKYGWMVTNIKDEPGKTGWAYTTGLFEHYQHPEVIIFGLKAESRHSILNWIGENVKEGKAFTADQQHDWVLENHQCWSKAVQKKWYHDLLGWTNWFYRDGDEVENFPCVQAIWPDKDGHYPWEPEYGYSDQPLLYETELIAATMVHFVGDSELSAAEWPFDCDPHTSTYVSRCVVEDGALIELVVHDHDGDWQFIGPVADISADGCKVLCFHCVVERDPTIKTLAGLPVGMRALRDSISGEWEWQEVEKEEEQPKS